MRKFKFTSASIFQYFLQGLLVLAPITVTVYLIVQIFTWLDQLVPIYINLSGDPAKPFFLPGLGFVLVMLGVLVVGYISSFFVINRVFSVFDHWLEKTPGVKIIYSLVKDFSEAFAGKKRKFNKTVLVSVQQPDVWQIGFITNEDLQEFDMLDHIAVYVPLSYSLTGITYFVKRDRVKLLKDVKAQDAMKFAISGGVAEVEDHHHLH
jgi:uncharacterized membrane protein